jgi:hypothetical protein
MNTHISRQPHRAHPCGALRWANKTQMEGQTMTDERTELDNCPVFPVTAGHDVWSTELTLRDWFADQALIGLVSAQSYRMFSENCANKAYEIADAMLKERGK